MPCQLKYVKILVFLYSIERVNFQRQAWSKVYLIQPDVIKFASNLDRRGCDRMVVGFTNTHAIGAYHH